MRKFLQNVLALTCTAMLSLSMAACGQPAADDATSASADDEPAVASERDETDPVADGRIDVTTTGSQLATFHGAKYIVSDVTVDQEVGERITEGLGLQEICVVSQPESWEQIESIGWDRNSISYARIGTEWGSVSYRYEYVNEASGVATTQEYSRTSEEAYFQGFDDVRHVTVGDHEIAYVLEEGDDPAMGIADLEAGEGATSRSVSVYAFEQRASKCALLVTATCAISDESAFGLSGDDMVRSAYEPLSFAGKDDAVDAASFVADIAITNADGSREVAIGRNGDSLISYAEHAAVLLGSSNADDTLATVAYDFAPQDMAADDADAHEVDGHAVRSRLDGDTLVAWVDVNGAPLRVETALLDGEDVPAALDRAIAGRVIVQ